LKPTHGLQENSMDKSFKYNSRQPLVHRDCHQLPKPNMGAPQVLSTWVLRKIIEKIMLEIFNPLVLILIDSIALVDKVVQRNLVER
jgi:hypothetical protein